MNKLLIVGILLLGAGVFGFAKSLGWIRFPLERAPTVSSDTAWLREEAAKAKLVKAAIDKNGLTCPELKTFFRGDGLDTYIAVCGQERFTVNVHTLTGAATQPADYRKDKAGMDRSELQAVTATMLNLNGHLCAQIVNMRPLQVGKDKYEVTCIEYRGGSGTVRYIFNAATGIAHRS